MKVTDWLVRIIGIAAFLTFLFAPDRFHFPVMLFSFAVIGLWGIFFPARILGWAKSAHPNLDVEDRSLLWIPRFIGCVFLCMALLLMLAFRGI